MLLSCLYFKKKESYERRVSDWSAGVCSSDLAADLTRGLLTFARAEPARPEMTDVDACITSFAQLIERTIGVRIALTLDLQTQGLRCWLDRDRKASCRQRV